MGNVLDYVHYYFSILMVVEYVGDHSGVLELWYMIKVTALLGFQGLAQVFVEGGQDFDVV